uniref:Uncharacterized protein n=1 Tax=Anguilla anguilla TaxID=7936 RepID=A0A0E9SMI1_ANGAN
MAELGIRSVWDLRATSLLSSKVHLNVRVCLNWIEATAVWCKAQVCATDH